MLIKVNGKHIDIGDALREHVETVLPASVSKYAENPINASVTFSPDRHEFKCDCTVHLSTGMIAKATGRSGEVYAALDEALEHLEKQLRRYKRRLKDHHRISPVEKFDAATSVYESRDDEEEEAAEDLAPVIIAESTTSIMTLASVGDAVMHMDLSGESVLVFHNEKTSTLNVVYRRDDGNIGWIDPTPINRAS